jgi:hypothetical protein
MAGNKKVNMVFMRNGLVTAVGSMFMFSGMVAALVLRRAGCFICCFRNFVLINMTIVHMVQMSVM